MNRTKFAVVLPLVALLAGCGGGSSPASQSASTGAPSSSQPSGEPIEVPFWTTFGQKNLEAVQTKADAFAKLIEQNTGKKVTIKPTYEGGYDEVRDKITKGFSAGNVPAMAIAYPDHVANYLASESTAGQYVYRLDDTMVDPNIGFGKQAYLGDTSGIDDYVEAFVDEGTHYMREGTYSMPLMKSSEVMFYNFDAVKAGLLTYDPEIAVSDDKIAQYVATMSWDELLRFSEHCLAHKATVLDTMKQPIWYDSDSNLFISKMFQEEIGYCSIGADGKGVIDFESGANRTKAEAFVNDLVAAKNKGLITTKGVNNTYGSDSFKAGESIFEIGSSGGTGYTMPEGAAFTVAVAPVPASNDNPLYVSQGPTVTFLKNPGKSDAVNAERFYYAWQFYKYLTNPDNNVYLCIYGSEGYLPVRYSAYETREFRTFLDEGEIYADTARVLIDDINGRYFNAAVFKGSAGLRDQCGGIVTGALLAKDSVTNLFDAAIANAKKGF